MDLISLASIALGVLVVGPTAWVLAGLPKLWGPERGFPFCGHPFELTWDTPAQYMWRCPRCGTEFEREVDGPWRALRPMERRDRDGRQR